MRKAAFLYLLLLVGCMPQAMGTPPPPLTLTPPPTLTFAGECTNSRDLSNWLEFSTFYVSEFRKLVSEAAAKHINDTYDDVVMMARLRTDFSGIAAPDCAQSAQQMIVVAMSQAISSFQAFMNQDADGLGNMVAEVLAQFDQVAVIQGELMTQLESQLQSP